MASGGETEKTGRTAAVKVVNTEYAQGGKIRDRFDREHRGPFSG